MGQRKVAVFMLLGILFLVGAVLLGYPLARWQNHRPTPPPPSVVDTPMYPGAQDMKIERPLNTFGPIISFSTTDDPAKIREFYSNRLLKEGWAPVDLSESSDVLSFKYGDGPYYQFAVDAKRVSPDKTEVIVRVESIPRID